MAVTLSSVAGDVSVESTCVRRTKELFGAEHANVQPLSGSTANLSVYQALLQPGDKILGMSLAAGGHLTHGQPVSVTGKWWTGVLYGVRREDGLIDFDEVA